MKPRWSYHRTWTVEAEAAGTSYLLEFSTGPDGYGVARVDWRAGRWSLDLSRWDAPPEAVTLWSHGLGFPHAEPIAHAIRCAMENPPFFRPRLVVE